MWLRLHPVVNTLPVSEIHVHVMFFLLAPSVLLFHRLQVTRAE